MIEPIDISFDVECSAEHSFRMWTERFAMWWPRGHNASGEDDAVAVLEPRLGGRIYERTADGREFDWGVVTRFDPPTSLGYRWHIGRGANEATDVLLTFVAVGVDRCRVDLVHSGWDALGDAGVEFRTANFGGWDALIPNFTKACASERSLRPTSWPRLLHRGEVGGVVEADESPV